MRKILVLCNFIPPEHSATGRIAYHIAQELGKTEEVHLLCLSGNEEETLCEGVKVSKLLTRYGKYQKQIRYSQQCKGLKRFFAKIHYTLYYKYAKRKGLQDLDKHLGLVKKAAKDYVKKHNIDVLITISNPFEIQIIGSYLKEAYPRLQWFPYLMDSNRHNVSYASSVEQERKILNGVERILIVPSLLFDGDFCEDFASQMEVVDLPIIPTETRIGKPNNRDGIKLMFAGMFYKDIRDPVPLMELMIRLPEQYSLELYCAGCMDIVRKYKEILGDRLIINGFISPRELEDKMGNAHIVLNIGNAVLNQVPSKAYDLMATGKPLLNFYQNEKDLSLEHLRKYPLGFHINYQDLSTFDVAELEKWIFSVADKTVDYLEATQQLESIRLTSVVQKIRSIINKEVL